MVGVDGVTVVVYGAVSIEVGEQPVAAVDRPLVLNSIGMNSRLALVAFHQHIGGGQRVATVKRQPPEGRASLALCRPTGSPTPRTSGGVIRQRCHTWALRRAGPHGSGLPHAPDEILWGRGSSTSTLSRIRQSKRDLSGE